MKGVHFLEKVVNDYKKSHQKFFRELKGTF